jgi:hypothetical protein
MVRFPEPYVKGDQMCFSAGASFTAGVLLTFVGTETIKKVHKPSQIIFAGIPAFFALQQFSEGILWLTMTHTGYAGLQNVFTYIFIVMAQIVWPAMIPLSVFLIIHGVYAEISGRHLVYQSSRQDSLGMAALIVYLAVTILPIFVSSIKRMFILGIIMALAFAVSAFFYMQCLTSVWCFFAAVISFAVFYIIRDAHKKFHMSPA